MMKKNGFTLAEVLITLAIIGVVATMTLPALMTNTAEQQAKTGLKKGINTLTEAAQMSQAIDGYGFEGVNASNTSDGAEDAQSIYGILSRRTQVDYVKSGKGELGDAANYTVFFRDGSAVSFNPDGYKQAGNGKNPSELQDDNLPYGIPVLFDTNGKKGPNMISNCLGASAGANSTDTGEASTCNDRSKRVIKDQFGIRLRGGIAVPNGMAAKWAFEN